MKEPKINIGNSQREKIITKELKINQNVFIYNQTIIPLNNISKIGVVDAAKEPYPIYAFIIILVGLLCFCAKNAIAIIVGLLMIAIGSWTIYKTYISNQQLGEYLVLGLNSGEKIYLYSRNHDFTIEIMDVIINCINSGKEYRVNMENCNIEACQFGENNIMIED